MNKNAGSVTEPKPLTLALLRLLVGGEFHSGEMLAQRLGVSRASVSNALHGVEQLGLTLYSVRGRGYCLANPPQWLDAAQIQAHLAGEAAAFQIEIMDSAISSNTLLLQRAAQGGSPHRRRHRRARRARWQCAGAGVAKRRAWQAGQTVAFRSGECADFFAAVAL